MFSSAAGQDIADISPSEEDLGSQAALPVDAENGAERPKRQFLAGLALGSLIAHRRPYYGYGHGYGYGYPQYGGYYGGYPHYGYSG